MINKPPPLNRDYSRNPYIKPLKRRGYINHGSTLSHVVSKRFRRFQRHEEEGGHFQDQGLVKAEDALGWPQRFVSSLLPPEP